MYCTIKHYVLQYVVLSTVQNVLVQGSDAHGMNMIFVEWSDDSICVVFCYIL